MTNLALSLENVSLSFNESSNLLSIKQLDFSQGIHCLWGISGSGKTSFLRLVSGRPFDVIVAGILSIGTNKYHLNSDKDMANYNAKYISAMYQDNFLIDDFNVLENLLLPYYLHKETYEVDEFSFLTEKLNIQSLLQKQIGEISRGEAQRVRLVRSLLFAQTILILDEPLVYLDKEMKATCFDLIKDWVLKKKLITFFSTHDQELKNTSNFSTLLQFEDGLLI